MKTLYFTYVRGFVVLIGCCIRQRCSWVVAQNHGYHDVINDSLFIYEIRDQRSVESYDFPIDVILYSRTFTRIIPSNDLKKEDETCGVVVFMHTHTRTLPRLDVLREIASNKTTTTATFSPGPCNSFQTNPLRIQFEFKVKIAGFRYIDYQVPQKNTRRLNVAHHPYRLHGGCHHHHHYGKCIYTHGSILRTIRLNNSITNGIKYTRIYGRYIR